MDIQKTQDKEEFYFLKEHIIKNGSMIELSKRLISNKETISKEVSFEDKYIELLIQKTQDKIIVIDKNNKIPPYYCIVIGDDFKMSPYYSRFDTNEDLNIRKNDWSEIITKLTSNK